MLSVTAIMPTRGRHKWALEAVKCFRAQTYPNKELILLDDEDYPSFEPQLLSQSGVKYARIDQTLNISQKRNWLCRHAEGEVIMHFDSDDWSAPDRMEKQIAQMEDTGLDVVGYRSLLFYKVLTKEVYQFTSWSNYAIGTSLCYYKSFWAAHPYNEQQLYGEDNDLVLTARLLGQLHSVLGGSNMVARIHPNNTSPRDMNLYKKVNIPLPEGFLVD